MSEKCKKNYTCKKISTFQRHGQRQYTMLQESKVHLATNHSIY